jgi:hypothetical protein
LTHLLNDPLPETAAGALAPNGIMSRQAYFSTNLR